MHKLDNLEKVTNFFKNITYKNMPKESIDHNNLLSSVYIRKQVNTFSEIKSQTHIA